MPITLEELQVVLKSKSDELRKDFKAVRKIGKDTADRIGKAFNKIPFSGAIKNAFSLKGAFAAVAGAAGLGLVVERSVEAADSIAKLSKNIGLNTGLLQELSFAASQTGVAQNDLNASLLRFNRRLAEAANGNKEFKKGYDDLGISITDSNGKLRSSEDVLFEVSDSIAALGNEADQARVLFRLFGDSGFRLVNLFKGGSSELRKFQEQARSLGLVIEDELLTSAEDTADQFDILSKALKTQVTSAVLTVAPEIQKLTQLMIEGVQVAAEYVDGFGQIANASRIASGETKTLQERQAFLIQQENELLEQREELKDSIFTIGAQKQIDEINIRLGQTRNEIQENIEKFKEQKSAIRDVNSQTEINIDRIKELGKIQQEAQKIVTETGKGDRKKQIEEEIALLEEAQANKLEIEGDLNEAIIEKRIELDEFKQEQIEAEIERLRERNELLNELGTEQAEIEIARNEEKIEKEKAKVKEGTNFAIAEQVRENKMKAKLRDQQLKDTGETFANIQTLAKGNSKALFEIAKAGGIATATIDGVVAVQKAAAALPFPANIPGIAVETTRAAVNIARIARTGFQKGLDKVPGVQTGGDTFGPVNLNPGEGIINTRANEKLERFLDMALPSRGELGGGQSSAGDAPARIVVSFDTDRLVDFVEARLVERGKLDTSLEVA